MTDRRNENRPESRGRGAVGYERLFEPHFTALEAGHLIVQVCADCDRQQWPPRSICATCGSVEIGWSEPVSLYGSLFSWTVVHVAQGTEFEESVPYAVALIELEGTDVRMYGHVPDPAGLEINSQVELVLADLNGARHPYWKLSQR